ncbi:MAG TPA: hypothetical protein VFG59_01100 [Anaeromyxobacter sp.]|nr:hypothetical protein [Anaeromyxobacter sp.]
MKGWGERRQGLLRRLEQLFGFHPWMLALAVFLACAIGIAVMQGARERPVVVARVGVGAQR